MEVVYGADAGESCSVLVVYGCRDVALLLSALIVECTRLM